MEILKNTKIQWLISLVVVTMMTLPLGFSLADRKKIGYVDNALLLVKFDKAIRVRDKMKTYTAELQKNVITLEKGLDSLKQAYRSTPLPKQQQEAYQRYITSKEREYMAYVQQANKNVSQKETEKMQPVYGELNTFIRDYGKEHGYDMIWGATSSGNIVYAREGVNLTEDVLKYIENKREKDTPKQTK